MWPHHPRTARIRQFLDAFEEYFPRVTRNYQEAFRSLLEVDFLSVHTEFLWQANGLAASILKDFGGLHERPPRK